MMYLNLTCKIIHRDLKGENIFLARSKSDGSFSARVGDFGLAVHSSLNDMDRRVFNVGSSGWMVKMNVYYFGQREASVVDLTVLGLFRVATWEI
jgi:hypothetical protein